MTPAIWLADTRPLGAPVDPSRGVAQVLPELVLAGILLVVALRSLRKWLRVRFDARSMGEQVLFSLHITSRVGTWFALAGFFVGYAFVDEPQNFGWYVFVIIGLASLQLLTSFSLWRSSDTPDRSRAERPE